MTDFNGKIIKVQLNATSGWVCITGAFIKMDANFIVIRDSITKKIHYLSMFYVRNVEIVSDCIAGDSDE